MSHGGEAELRSTFRLVSCHHESQKKNIRSHDRIFDTFRNTTPAANLVIVRKSQIETNEANVFSNGRSFRTLEMKNI